MNLTRSEYAGMVDNASPKSRILRDCIGAFSIGGLICTVGQAFTDLYSSMGYDIKDSRCLTSVTLIFLGALMTALGWYDNIAKFGGAGTLVPITGFSNAVASPAMEFKSEGYIPGLGAKMFIIAGPVIVYGVVASVIYGLFIFVGQNI